MISFGSDKFVLAEGRHKVTKNVFRTHVYPSFDFGLKTILQVLCRSLNTAVYSYVTGT